MGSEGSTAAPVAPPVVPPAGPPGVASPAPATSPAAFGVTCAVAAQGQRDLQRLADADPELFPRPPFDGSVFSTLAMANAFSAPWLSADDLRTANRASLWAFRVDWFADHLATDSAQLAELTASCLAVADGAPPADPLTAMLAGLRDDLSGRPGFAAAQPVWCEELRRMLDAMTVEFGWRATRDTLTVARYLDNADNLGSSFVNVSHWLANPDPGPGSGTADRVLAATRAQQRVIRVLNDLATVDRDRAWGDLNLLLLNDIGDVPVLLAELTRDCDTALAPLRADQPRLAEFLYRQVEFCRGFYGLTDYWGQW
jgi:hypothetical protein